MKKRIFISMHYMEIGGAEMALVGLLQALDYSKYDVDLFLHAHRGEMMLFIPKEVNLLPEISSYKMLEEPILKCIKQGFVLIAFLRVLSKLIRKLYFFIHRNFKEDDDFFFSYFTTPILPQIGEGRKYDLAISFLTPHNIVLKKVNAYKKAAWIHTDYLTLKVASITLKVWNKYDKIISISSDITKTFIQVFPSLSNKIVEMENILSPEFVRKRSSELDVSAEIPKSNNTINLLSVGRFCEAKNYDNVPDICKRVNSRLSTLDFRLCIRWYIIGFGGDEELIRRKIEEAGMQDHVIILGKKSNPYPYIKACDIYVQPSRYEGKSVTVREAQMLCKPVVVTNYATASSQIIDGVDGKIVPMDNKGCAQGLAEFIMNTELQKRITEYLHTHDYGNEAEVSKIDLLFE